MKYKANFLDESIPRKLSGLSTKLSYDEVLILEALVEFRRVRGLTENKSQLARQILDFAFDHNGKTFITPRTAPEIDEFMQIIENIVNQKNTLENESNTNETEPSQPD